VFQSLKQQSIVNLSTPICDFLDALVHPSARADAVAVQRHLAFMVPRVFGSLMALGVFPVFLAWRGVPSAPEFFVLAWMIVPISTACFLSRTGRYDVAQGLSAFALTGIVTFVAAGSGGINSVAVIWFVLILLEAALSGSRRVIALAALLALAGIGLLTFAGAGFDLVPAVERPTGMLAVPGILSALLYATGIALNADALAGADVTPLFRQAGQWRLPAFSETDVITHHGHGGRIIYASANAQAVLGASPFDLQSCGLFDRIHIADRPAYLHALSEAAATGDTCEIEFRLRRHDQAEFIWIEMRCQPFGADMGRGGDVTSRCVVAVMRDITLRKTEEQALINARIEAERASTAKTRFLVVRLHGGDPDIDSRFGKSTQVVRPSLDCEHAADSGSAISMPSAIHDGAPKGRPGCFPMSGHAVDPSTAEPAAMNSPANPSFQVQKRA